jgi:hypothetical protein
MLSEMRVVFCGSNSADDTSSVVTSEEQLRLCVLMKGMPRVQQVRDVAPQRRHPVRISAIEPVWQLDERPLLGCVADRSDVDQRSLGLAKPARGPIR